MSIWDYVARNTFDSPSNQIKLLVQAVSILLPPSKIKILDAGGGLVDRASLLEVLGDRTVIDLQKGLNVDVVGDIHALPFANASFDLISLFMVMEHLHDPLIAIKECQRVLRPRGLIIGTTVQYWHTHAHPNDYFRYTRFGLEHIFKAAKLPINKIWSSGGPFLVLYHVLELNLPSFFRKVILLSCPIFNFLDKLCFNHEDKRKYSDSVGWSFIAQKASS